MINLYKDRDYKPYLVLPAILFALFILAIFVYPGITPGIDLKGGTEIRASIDKSPDTAILESKLKQEFQLVNLQIVTTEGPLGYRVLIQFAEENRIGTAERLLKQAKEQNSAVVAIQAVNALGPFASEQMSEQETTAKTISIAETEVAEGKAVFSNRLDEVIKQELNLGEDARISRNEIGAVIGKTFWDTAFFVTIVGFLLISIVVFIFFMIFFLISIYILIKGSLLCFLFFKGVRIILIREFNFSFNAYLIIFIMHFQNYSCYPTTKYTPKVNRFLYMEKAYLMKL